MGDINADGVKHGFCGVYSHDHEEGVVRIFDKDKTPGVTIWTYGYRPTEIPMGSGAPSKGYAEIWGGTGKIYGPDRTTLPAGDSLTWTEWMYPFQRTSGITFADRELVATFTLDPAKKTAKVALCPSGAWRGDAELRLDASTPGQTGQKLCRWSLDLRPDCPFSEMIELSSLAARDLARVRLHLSLGRPGATEHVLKPALLSKQ